jgi:glycosyltransferase involved in cell wall biosynthesis
MFLHCTVRVSEPDLRQAFGLTFRRAMSNTLLQPVPVLVHFFDWMPVMQRSIAITWGLSEIHGWGLLGVHTCLYMLDLGLVPLLLEQPAMGTLRPHNRERLSVMLPNYERIVALKAENPGKSFNLADYDVLHALSNGFVASDASARFRGPRNVGVIAYEETRFTADVLNRAKSWDAMVVHSSFNERLLTERGVPNVRVALQGIDPTEIYPGPATGLFGDRFVVFSGGKLEFRKGQDIVLAAFKRFHANHPEALLVTAWHNIWPQTALSMAESTHAPTGPVIDPQTNRLRLQEWVQANGLSPEGFHDLGLLGRSQIPAVLWNSHVAVFPNRCEGATNLVAMEAMGCGTPVILSANTGHLDLIGDDRCYALQRQTPVRDSDGSRIDWGESDIDELVDCLEQVFADQAEAKRKAARALKFVQEQRTWRQFAEAFITAVQP